MKIELKESEKLYPLGNEDLDGNSHSTNYSEDGSMKWFFAVMVGDAFSRPYWDAPNTHKVLAIFDDKKEAKEFMLKNIQLNIYLSFGWIVNK
jgi:hypothetical protein